MQNYSLTTILETLTKKNGKKRLLYNFGPVGGWNSSIITMMFFTLPFIEFAVLFNPYSFAYLGIAQSIIFYVVFSSMLMILVAGLIFALNTNLIRKITPSWNALFGERDITLVLSSGVTPYSKFFPKYKELVNENLNEEMMYKALLNALEEMEEENKEMLDAMKRNNNLRNRD
ncbi:MAG: hypothetical protein Q9M32_02010 [Sulfurimonas sp.]|nr:hypothetical protein [Sulfurimonas sp.]MDQ7060370.1 hypothetical protein [Sulfurimonas sp.]